MSYSLLKITANDSNWRLFSLRKSDPRFKSTQDKLLRRDNHTCHYCQFSSKIGLDIVNLDGNYRNNHADNLVAACPLCVQCLFLESIDQAESGGGTLIYLPELSQAQLNALCHVIFATLTMGGEGAQSATSLYRSLRLNNQFVEKELGEGMSNPALLGRLMVDAAQSDREHIIKLLETKVRLLPNVMKFQSLLRQWLLESVHELATGML